MIVITAPTGNIGRHLVSLLLDSAPARGEELRLIVRDPARLPEAVRERVEVVTGSHGDPAVVDRAFAGADAVFWLVPPNASRTPEDAYRGFTRPAANALAVHGVGHVVGVSALGRGTPVAGRAGLVTASLAMDDLIAGTGVAYRALANPSFFENVLEEAEPIREKGVFSDLVDADRKAPMVAVADIAAAAAGLLLDRCWTGTGSVPVLGPQDLSPNDLARIMTERLGLTVRYERQALDEVRATLVGHGLDPAFVEGIVDMKRAKDDGLDAGVARAPDTASPTTFEQWCAQTLEPAVLS
ncbi:NmrA family transcriptional regulator [Streptomyces sp. WAC 04229]|uniref:NAD(P)H-binding protein n=1 Tax=Streptomyces sp. WAC 04229 TaxID=2203206 RepID=UPI000F737FAF|nr:NAD(P)H-binding protein [Streptomyces sp. WAC 04229]RSN59787.1 NmrA family transcriptional regulator [Streptomyces sp. WAC 04229]